MNEDCQFKVVSIAAWCTVHDIQSSRRLGEAIREAIEASNSRVMLLASGSLSHRIWNNEDYEPTMAPSPSQKSSTDRLI
ncbi:3,4-dihydroxyphenylacetate 2,3-dioxygenase [Vibrio variabilis]|uniref:3,4-dihydroxyphenylacetate 2,3-dioxygenase n=1 Tax=Vibrio variabilis TaxID=990271 RepID=A0ABQ0JR91_9VIBR|nr:3,4-dihydroxyphenylacetate 2,3-dioxygenase [Vibrio variabilis]